MGSATYQSMLGITEEDVWKVTQRNFTVFCAFAYKLCYVLISSGRHYATSQKVADSIPYEVAVYFN
jgi:hypothetical protein